MEHTLFFFVFISLSVINSTKNIIDCGDGLEWDAEDRTCRSCRDESVFNKYTKKCQKVSGKGEQCSKGYKFDFVENICVDIDECNESIFPCMLNEQCVNVEGAFKCKRKTFCGQGYVFSDSLQECQDINECETISNVCGFKMICENVPGSWSCRKICPEDKPYYWRASCNICPEGFRLNQKTKKCEDIDECEGPYKLQCLPYKEKCVQMPGLSQCVRHCSGGTTEINGVCYDLDECATKTHNCTKAQMCHNRFGSFECKEPSCPKNTIFNSAMNDCTCKYGFSKTKFSMECEDDNECAAIPNRCKPHGHCVNIPGGFSCVCDEGFSMINGVCEDFDECKALDGVCGNLLCENIQGGHKCVCPSGLKINEYGICEDINECMESTNICNYNNLLFGEKYECFNLIGSFKCIKTECPNEYKAVTEGDSIRCELLNTKCSLKDNKICIQALPNNIYSHIIQLPTMAEVPHKLATIKINPHDYDDFLMQIIIRKANELNIVNDVDINNAIIVTHDDIGENSTLYLTESLRNGTEIIFDVYLKFKLGSQEHFHSLNQYHIFVKNDII